MDSSGGSVAKNIPAYAGDNGWIQKIPWGRGWLPTPVSLPWTEKPGGLQSIGSQRARHDLATKEQQ